MKPAASWGRALRIQALLAAVAGTASVIAWAATGGSFWPRWVLFGWGTAIAVPLALRAGLRARTPRGRWLAVHWRLSAVLAPVEIIIWLLIDTPQPFWPAWAILGIAIALAAHILVQRALPPNRERELAERVDVLTRSRRGVVDVQSAELKRIERDLHDGAQARIVSLAMNLGLARQLAQRDPDAADELIAEAQQSALAALDELRTVMSGIQPPVLSDRGLAGVARRLEAFDGTITVRSPAGGPTEVTLEIPCELSSQKTSSSSETD